MTTAGASLLDATLAERRATRWGPLAEFLLVGGATLFLLPLAWLLRGAVGLDSSELAVGFLTFHAAFVINDPHFSVSYLLFYKNVRGRALGEAFEPAQRARYLWAGFVVPLGLLAWSASAIASDSAFSLGLMMQLMFFLVGWHYVKQGFGVLSVLSARRGVRFTAMERTLVLTHCFAGWLYARSRPVAPGGEYAEKGVVFTSIPPPENLGLVFGIAFAFSTLGLVWALGNKWRREGRLPPLVPLCGFLVTVWLWVVYSRIDPLMVYMIPALHSLQYLYFVWLLKRNEARSEEGPPYFKGTVRARLGVLAASAVALGWLLFHGAPSFLDEAFVAKGTLEGDGVGPTPYFAALFTFVNIHHYFMDTVLWRRENPDTRFLREPSRC